VLKHTEEFQSGTPINERGEGRCPQNLSQRKIRENGALTKEGGLGRVGKTITSRIK